MSRYSQGPICRRLKESSPLARLSAGTYDSYRGRLSYGKEFANGLRFMLSGSYYESDGPSSLYYREFDTPETNHGKAERLDGETVPSFFATIGYRDFTLSGGFVNREKTVPTAPFGTVFNRGTRTYDQRAFVELKYAHKFANDIDVGARLHYDQYDYHGIYPFFDETGVVRRNQDSARARWVGFEAHATKAFECIRFSSGVSWRRATELQQRNYNESPFESLINEDSDLDSYGTFLETATHLTRKLTLSAGVRYDYYSTSGNTVNPRVGLIYKPAEATSIKLLYGQAYRAPNEFELNFRPPGALEPAEISPEKIRTLELVGEHYFNSQWRATASIFYSEIEDLIDPVPDITNPTLLRTGARDAEVIGGEVEVEAKLDNGWLARVSYSHQEANDGATGLILTNSPKDVAKLQLSIPLIREKLYASAELLYASDRLTLQRHTTGDTWLLNATIFSRELLPNLEFSASVYNLLDQKYDVPGGSEHVQDRIEQNGRTFRAKFQYRF